MIMLARARLVENMLEAETIQRMEWPACSLTYKHVWDMLRRCTARPWPPATVELHFLRSGTLVFPKV
ncbi:hypothetical protein TNCV_1938591 [Trichonephila clavipes]|nr:hypothetical protein TNCV_1938591 [Trichonephila clavipes]